MAPTGQPDELQGVRRLWVRSVLARRPWSAWLAGGLVGVAVVLAFDIASGSHVALGSALAIVALVVGLGGRRGDAIVVAATAVAVAAISGLWNDWGAAYT